MYLPPLLLPLLSYLSSNVQTPMSAPASTPARDIASYSTPALVQSQHLSLDWTINWSKHSISGSVQHDLIVKQGDVKEVVLDVRDLEIFGVSVDGEEIKGWTVSERHEVLGSSLTIPLASTPAQGTHLNLTVEYATSPSSSALGWLEAEQTKGGKHPYLYSQSQAIHARSLVPCQDTPSVKATYSASVKSMLPVLMSARRISPAPSAEWKDGPVVTYEYKQDVAIASYLIAIAAGKLAHKSFEQPKGKSWKTGVWTEPESLDAAFYEFSEDTNKFIEHAEDITGFPYDAWGSYDVLVLPPAFPYGGMENPGLTFATPTIVAGDRSLVDVVAHEISHSWFGNLIGCANWGSFWLNESWTTYLERLLMRAVHGEGARGISFVIGRKAMEDSLREYEVSGPKRFMRLVVPYKDGEDPDDAFSSIPYNKGSNLILLLEQKLGGLNAFLPYIRSYVSTFAGQSIDAYQWKDHLYEFWTKTGGDEAVKILDSIDWAAWFDGESVTLPEYPTYDTTLIDESYKLAADWTEASRTSNFTQFKKDDLSKLITDQTVVFLEKLEVDKALSVEGVKALDAIYGLSSAGNAELAWRFFQIALSTGSEYAQKAAEWVTDKGRMKFCRTTYKSLSKVDPDLAKKTFLAHAGFYHPIARRMIAKDLGVEL